MRRLAPLFLLLATAVPAAAAPDPRTPLCLGQSQQKLLRGEMRQLLSTVQQVTEALSKGECAAAARSARSAGTGMVGSSDPARELLAAVPESFRSLGLSVHRDFDEIAAASEAKAETGALLGQLAKTLAKCVGCHETYRANGFREECR